MVLYLHFALFIYLCSIGYDSTMMLPLPTLFTAHEPIDLRKVNGSFDTSDKITWTFNNSVE